MPGTRSLSDDVTPRFYGCGMPRPPRNNPDGGIHHVTNHRAGDSDLFETDRDRFLFLTLMKEAREETGVEVLEYCLMPNHYHLIVRCPFGTLDRFMHHLQGNYARAFNYRHAHKGPVFRARYYNVLVTTDEQFQLVCRYVHRNPAELGFNIGTYPWSSFAIYKQHDSSAHTIVRVEQAMIIGMFGSRAAYVEFVETDMGHDKFSLVSSTRSISVGTTTTELDLEELCNVVSQITGTDNQTIRSSTRGRRNNPRLITTILANELFPAETSQICTTLGYTSTTTFRTALARARRFRGEDQHLAAEIDAVRTAWNTRDRRAA